ncbi:MAG: hypothetical protein QOH93_659 [Chloroflexia bacterium]|jgi:hypothetical protein|nr:hypothetical protein [Chloroflexia bacterium]
MSEVFASDPYRHWPPKARPKPPAPERRCRLGNGLRELRGPRLLSEVQLHRRLEDLFGIEEAQRLLAPPTEPVEPTNPFDEIVRVAQRKEGKEGVKR